MKTLEKGPFLGLNNRLPDFALHKAKVGDFLRQAENVDITNSGNIKRRKATELVQALTAPHSLYMDSATTGYVVIASVMYRIALPNYTQTLFKILTSNDPVSYLAYAGSLYWSNGTDSGRIESGTNYPWALPTPATPVPTTVGGGLDPGWYQVAVAHARMSGATLLEEGGVSPSANYQLTAAGGLRIPLPGAVPGGTHITVYVSTVDGSFPLLQTTVAAGTSSVDITTLSTSLREAVQRYEVPLPAGNLFLHNGALCSFSGNNIYRGIPYRPGYCIKTEARIPLPSPVTNAISAQMGVYVTTTDMSYWFPGEDLKDVQVIADILPYGAVPGTAFSLPHNSKVGWFGNKGLVIADLQGNAEAVMADNVDVTLPATGVSAVIQADGFRKVVSCGYAVNLEHFAATTYTDYAFTSISGGYGTLADGIYNLSAPGDVLGTIGLGKVDFGTEALKHLPAVYLGVSSDTPMTLRVQAPDGVDYSYDARSSGADTRIQRIDPGKGLRANWFDLSLSGTSDFTLASVSFAPIASNRRI